MLKKEPSFHQGDNERVVVSKKKKYKYCNGTNQIGLGLNTIHSLSSYTAKGCNLVVIKFGTHFDKNNSD
jgi:hypothetical protein